MKKCSTWSVTTKLQIKTIMRYKYITLEWLNIRTPSTHPHTTHGHTQYTCTQDTHVQNTCTHNMHTQHAHVYNTHNTCTHTTHIWHTHSTHVHNTCTRRTHTQHTHTAGSPKCWWRCWTTGKLLCGRWDAEWDSKLGRQLRRLSQS